MNKNLILFVMLFCVFTEMKADYLNDIQAWIGEGENYSVLVVDFQDSTKTNSSFMWGIRYQEDSISAQEIFDRLMEADPKLNGVVENYISDIYYKNINGITPDDFSRYWLTYTQNEEGEEWVSNNGNTTNLGNEQIFGAVFSSSWPGPFPATPIPADKLPKERKLVNSTQISQWIGKGVNEVVLVVDFNDQNTPNSFAWGIRFDSDSITGQNILDAVAAADSNFQGSFDTYITDITYKESSGLTPVDYAYYWLSYTSNGDYNWIGNNGNSTKLGNDQWYGVEFTNQWPGENPDTAYTAIINSTGIEDIIIGGKEVTPSIQGVTYNDPLITLWASEIEVTRGYLNIQDTTITDKGSNKATFGVPENALGASTGNSLEVVSLGDSGVAILSFGNGKVITDRDGFDFVVFENGFNETTLELAHVEVSSDGINYYRFPSLSLTQTDEQITAFGTLDPALIYGLAGIHPVGVGTPFDLEVLADVQGLDIYAVSHVKIIDVIGAITGNSISYDTTGNVINDPFSTGFESGGFDLDAVGVINHTQINGLSDSSNDQLSIYPNPASTAFSINGLRNVVKITATNSLGRVFNLGISNDFQYNIDHLEGGMYILSIETDQEVINKSLQISK